MSANNYILIEKPKKKWLVTHRDAEEAGLLSKIGQADTLEEAVRMANDWQTDGGHFVEYGLHIHMPRKV